jgi:sugar phosphate isomerase/epimerase
MIEQKPDIVAACWTTGGDTVPLPGLDLSPVSLPERIELTGATGFSGFGIVHQDLAAYLDGGGTLAELRSHLDDAGITIVELEFLTDWWLPDPKRTGSDATLRLLVEAAGSLGARDVKIGPDINGGPFDLPRYGEALHRVAEEFAQTGTVVAIEFMPFSNVPSLAAGVELVRAADHPNAGLMVDLWHLVRAGDTLADLARTPIDLITSVELDDGSASAVGDGYEDTIHRRLLCGTGDFPVVEFISTLSSMGWAGPWGLEIINSEYRKRPVGEALADAYATTVSCLARAGVG